MAQRIEQKKLVQKNHLEPFIAIPALIEDHKAEETELPSSDTINSAFDEVVAKDPNLVSMVGLIE